jgi:four helix bundle protein
MDRKEGIEKLEKRLIDFSVMILNLTERLPESKAVRYLADQLIRSGTSPALNYGEARSAESSVDFIHKMKVCLKELREAYITLQILQKKIGLNKEKVSLEQSISECNELISIFVKSIQTAEENRKIKPVK